MPKWQDWLVSLSIFLRSINVAFSKLLYPRLILLSSRFLKTSKKPQNRNIVHCENQVFHSEYDVFRLEIKRFCSPGWNRTNITSFGNLDTIRCTTGPNFDKLNCRGRQIYGLQFTVAGLILNFAATDECSVFF